MSLGECGMIRGESWESLGATGVSLGEPGMSLACECVRLA